jgi:hypothetical protein
MIAVHFNDVEKAALVQTERVDAERLQHHNSQETIVAWAREDKPVSVEIAATGTKAYRLDLYGNITLLRPQNGVYRFQLSPATCEEGEGCFLGGEAVILVQPESVTTVKVIAENDHVETLTVVQE